MNLDVPSVLNMRHGLGGYFHGWELKAHAETFVQHNRVARDICKYFLRDHIMPEDSVVCPPSTFRNYVKECQDRPSPLCEKGQDGLPQAENSLGREATFFDSDVLMANHASDCFGHLCDLFRENGIINMWQPDTL